MRIVLAIAVLIALAAAGVAANTILLGPGSSRPDPVGQLTPSAISIPAATVPLRPGTTTHDHHGEPPDD